MFNIRGNKKGSDGVRKSIQKLLDPKRDPDKRLANLRHIIENATQVADHQVDSRLGLKFKPIFRRFSTSSTRTFSTSSTKTF
jgi:hypothetical protein